MKKLFTLLFVVVAFGANAQKTLVHYWNFNAAIDAAYPNGPDYDTSRATQLTPTISLVPGASLSYTGAYTDALNDSGNTTNLRIPETNGLLENALRVRSTYGVFTMSLPTTNYKNIIVEYGVYRSGSGSGYNTVTYTTDGVNWDSTGLIISYTSDVSTTVYPAGMGTYTISNAVGAPLDSVSLDFSNISGANNNPKFQIQINFQTSAKGNDRYDNLTLEGDPVSLPLLLQSFNGTITNNNAKLTWTASNEVNVKEYQVEASTDRKNFEVLDVVSANNKKGLNDYEYTGVAPKTTTYYRLKMIDNNGSFNYSSLVALSGAVSNNKITAFPNPAVNTITLTHEQAIAGATIKILSVDGKTVSLSNVQTGAIQSSIDVSKLGKGSYLVYYENNGEKAITQFVK